MSSEDRIPRLWWSPTWGVLQAPYDWSEGIWLQVLSAGHSNPVLIPMPADARPLVPTGGPYDHAVPR